nr:hypothetical protein [Actinomycetales bacterium]
MDLATQVERLINLGVPGLAGLDAEQFRALAAPLPGADGRVGDPPGHEATTKGAETTGPILAIHPSLVPPSRLAPLLERAGRPGFVVVDMTDLDSFTDSPAVAVPDAPLYLLHGVERGDEHLNFSSPEAAAEIEGRGRSPLTINEGISLLLHRPELLEPNRCFLTIGSRLEKGKGYDSRTPGIWISGGTGRDGAERRNAPKVGWCWWNNRHTWLGFASAESRTDSGSNRTRA